MATDPITAAANLLEDLDEMPDPAESFASETYTAARLEKALAFLDPLPAPGYLQHKLITEDLPTYVLLEAAVTLGGRPLELLASTMTYNQEAITTLANLLHRFPDLQIDLLASTQFENSEPALCDLAAETLQDRTSIAYTRNHAKTIALRFDNGHHYTLDGSANWRRCKRIENITITHSRDQFDFFKKWILKSTRQ